VLNGIDDNDLVGKSVSSAGDVNDDGILTPADFTAWIANFNAEC